MIVIESGFTGDLYPLDHPRIAWRTFPGTVTASSEADQFDAIFAAQPQTWNSWQPTAMPATWEIDAGDDERVSYFAISGHDLGSLGITVHFEVWDGSDFVVVLSHSPDDNGPILALIDPVDAEKVAFRFTGGTGNPTISNLRIGDVTEWPRLSTFTGTPITDARQIAYRDNESQTGEFLGRTVQRSGLQFGLEVQYLPEDWIASEYADFREFCDRGDGTFWIAPKPGKYLHEVAYAKPAQPIEAPRATPNHRISRDVSMSLRGFQRV